MKGLIVFLCVFTGVLALLIVGDPLAPRAHVRYVPAAAEMQGPGYLCRRATDGALECIDLDSFIEFQKLGDAPQHSGSL